MIVIIVDLKSGSGRKYNLITGFVNDLCVQRQISIVGGDAFQPAVTSRERLGGLSDQE